MSEMTYDRRSYELAEVFLADTPGAGNKEITHRLGQAIQRTIEEFLADVYDPDLRRLMEEPLIQTCSECGQDFPVKH